MSNSKRQRKSETTEQIRSYVHRHCHRMTAQEIAKALGVSVRVIDLYNPRASR